MPINVASYFNNPENSDMIIRVGEESNLFAHRMIMCPHSGYFRNLVSNTFSDLQKNEHGQVIVEEKVLDVSAVRCVVGLMYGCVTTADTERLSLIESVHVLSVADFWMVEQLDMSSLAKHVLQLVQTEKSEEICYHAMETLLTAVSGLMSKMETLATAAVRAFLKCRDYMLQTFCPETVSHWMCKLPMSAFDGDDVEEFLVWLKTFVATHPSAAVSEDEKQRIVQTLLSSHPRCSPKTILDGANVVSNVEVRNQILTQYISSLNINNNKNSNMKGTNHAKPGVAMFQHYCFIESTTNSQFRLPYQDRVKSIEVYVDSDDNSNLRFFLLLGSGLALFRHYPVVLERQRNNGVYLLFWFRSYEVALEDATIVCENGSRRLEMNVYTTVYLK